jgi:uncharacterized protein (TIGR03435 family)
MAGILIATGTTFAQTTPTPATHPTSKLTFDVASVRPSPPMDQATLMASLNAGKLPQSMHIQGSRATFTYMSLKELIANGYKVRPYQVTGPEWMATDRFEIAAKLPEGATRDDVPGMLQALLIERFKLVTHLETKEHPVLALTIGKAGLKLKEVATAPVPLDEDAPLKPGETRIDSVDGPMRLSKNPDGSTTYNMGARGTFTLRVDGQNGTMHMVTNGVTMKGFAVMLTSLGGGVGRQIVDMTGLNGNYELAVDFSLSDLVASLHDQGIDIPTGPSAGSADPSGNATIADALGKLGLKLEKSKAMTDQLIIDHVEKAATEN